MGIVGTNNVYHIDLNTGEKDYTTVFARYFSIFRNHRAAELKSAQILSYTIDSAGQWCALYGVSSPDSGVTINGYIQLYSKKMQQDQMIEGIFIKS